MRQGKSVRLRQATPDDAPLVHGWRDDPGYHDPFQEISPMPLSFLEGEFAHDPYLPESKGWWIILSPDTDEPMGMVLHFNPSAMPHYHALEVGWEVRPEFRGRGIASEAASILVNYLFNLTSIQRIQAAIAVGNEASGAVARRVGMQSEGICRKAGFGRGLPIDLQIYSILREEWRDEESYIRGRPIA
ncbi:MAG: GNAT family N-acetyltransferase [Chloroflexota bacterium]